MKFRTSKLSMTSKMNERLFFKRTTNNENNIFLDRVKKNDSDAIKLKEIDLVHVSHRCKESYPCQHEVMIKYKDGTENKEWLNGRDIAKNYFSYLKISDKTHFSGYFVQFILFGNKANSLHTYSPDVHKNPFSKKI